jgi:hypothetical protein
MKRKEAQESANKTLFEGILRTKDGRRQVATTEGLYHRCHGYGNHAVHRYGLIERCAKNVQVDDKGMVGSRVTASGW